MASRIESAPQRPRMGPGQLFGWFLVSFALLVALAAAVAVVRWLSGVTLTGLVERVVGDSPVAVRVITGILAWVVVIFLFMLPMVTYQIYALRKIMGFMQARVGPTNVGPLGLLQTPADVLKLLTKEDVIPRNADRAVFTIAPFLVLVPASMVYLVIPFGNTEAGRYSLVASPMNIGLLFTLAISSVAVIGVISAGWASCNKYSLLGGMRSAAQLVTYEVPLSLGAIAAVIASGSLNLQEIAGQQTHVGEWLLWPSLLGGVLFMLGALAELSHVPFDLPEAESELVSGFNVEYSGMKFAMFFLAEFSNAFTLSALAVTLFLGGWQSPFPESWPILGWDHGVFALFWFFAKSFGLVFGLFWVRATVPRVRIDQLMGLGWKLLIPVGVINLLAVAALRLATGW